MPVTTPSEILDQMVRPGEWDGWVPTHSGKGYRPWAKVPGPVDLGDVAYGLAHTFRYGGQIEPPITVAEHCVLAADIVKILWPNKPHLELAAFMHDASEAYLHDIQGPLRRRVKVHLDDEVISWSESDLRVTVNICRQFGITEAALRSPEVAAADVLAVCFEKRDCPTLRPGEWGLPEIPEEVAHLKMKFGVPGHTKAMFLVRASELGLSF